MNDRIMNISNVITENPKKYKQNARKKIIVNYVNDNISGKREEYLDDPRLSRDVNSFINFNKNKRLAIHLDCLNRTWVKRLICNLIMLIFEAGAFFAIPALNNLIFSGMGATSSVIGVLNVYFDAVVIGGMFYYVNQKKFYYNDKELKNLKITKHEIDKAYNILAEAYRYKELEFEHSRERDKIDYQDTIIKNHNRNVDIYFETQRYRREVDERIERGVEEKLKNNTHRTLYGDVSLGDLLYYPKRELTRKQKFKKMIRNVGRWIAESFEDPEYDKNGRRK